ncbi:MAG: hypothetical protein AAFW81_06995 [Pseudomonadota bacterium]
MNDERDEIAGNEDAKRRESGGGAPARMRFKGIVEQGSPVDGAPYGVVTVNHEERRWNAQSRQVWQASRLVSLFVFFSFLIGPPLGNFLAYRQINGDIDGWSPFAAYGTETVLFAFIVPTLVLLAGYLLSRAMTMMNAAESIASAAQQYVTPDVTAAYNADAVGEVVRGHMNALNEGLDGALSRLASVEAMIRQHVEAIELAGDAIEHKATGAVERVADERSRLMQLTESLNAHADSFAAAIAERASASIEALQSADHVSERAEQDFDQRLTRLEQAAGRAVESFEALRTALVESTEHFAASAQSIDDAAANTEAATKRANAAADAAAESAARNAANVSASAARAVESSKEAAAKAIEAAREEAERVSNAALEAAAGEAAKVKDATINALADMTGATGKAVETAREDAGKATRAADEVTQAARLAGEAAQKAAADIAAARDDARKNAEEALTLSQSASEKIEGRNQALADARAALEKENARLEGLIKEQRQRADRLAEAIASQTDRLTRLAEAQLREQEAAVRLAAAQSEEAARTDKADDEAPAATRQAATQSRQKAKAGEDKRAAAEAKPEDGEPAAGHEPPELPLEPEARANGAKTSGAKSGGPKSNGERAAKLDELARDIAERRPRGAGSKTPPKTTQEKVKAAKAGGRAGAGKSKGNVSWREILDAAEEAEPIELRPAEKKPTSPREDAAAAIRIISDLQAFTYDLETRLYGDPPPALQERYDRGDRNIFANRLLRLNEADVKRRIRSESARDRNFEKNVHGFLQGFEKLLEDATTSETADEELEEYLSSPLGRVYLLIGATVGYFA